jgi:hypothetical protein
MLPAPKSTAAETAPGPHGTIIESPERPSPLGRDATLDTSQ